MKRISPKHFLLCYFMAQQMITSAQIKIADNSYKEQMSATNYITEPFSIRNVFETYDGTFLHDYMCKNIVGDTLYTIGINQISYIIINHNTKNILCNYSDSIPPGYYRVTGLFLGADSTPKEIADELYPLIDSGYTTNLGGYERFIEGYTDDYSGNGLNFDVNGEKNMAEIKLEVQKRLFDGKKMDLTGFLTWVRLEALDSHNVYYLESNYLNPYYQFFFPVKYYNFLCKELKGKDVFITYSDYYRPSFSSKILDNRIIDDVLTGVSLLQKDTLFHCVDVIVNDCLRPICILEGKNTGKFSLYIDERVDKSYYHDDLHREGASLYYYKTSSGVFTLWNSTPTATERGKLIRKKLFCVYSITQLNTRRDRNLFIAKDLNEIYAQTEKIRLLNAIQRKQENEKYKSEYLAKQARQKHELCAKYGNDLGTLIANGKVTLGMTPEMCKLSWGTPIQISNMVDATGKYTVWKYNINTCIYFFNGKVSRITN